jgi:TIR domain
MKSSSRGRRVRRYPNAQGEMMKAFVEELKQALTDYVDPYLDEEIYIDKEQLGGGDHYNEVLAQAICQSLCMIVVYVPKYERHEYCRREYRAMEILEQRRVELCGQARLGNRGMIIPIILRGDGDLPDKIRDHAHFCNFTKYSTASQNIRSNPECVEQLERVALNIYEIYQAFEGIDACGDCAEFALPSSAEAPPWRQVRAAPFPGRQV